VLHLNSEIITASLRQSYANHSMVERSSVVRDS